ncbi:MAG: hypothetical protein KA792_01815 [Bacteroidales bacterium]|nr:hypothetical protein [Bacteroidales bacterium]
MGTKNNIEKTIITSDRNIDFLLSEIEKFKTETDSYKKELEEVKLKNALLESENKELKEKNNENIKINNKKQTEEEELKKIKELLNRLNIVVLHTESNTEHIGWSSNDSYFTKLLGKEVGLISETNYYNMFDRMHATDKSFAEEEFKRIIKSDEKKCSSHIFRFVKDNGELVWLCCKICNVSAEKQAFAVAFIKIYENIRTPYQFSILSKEILKELEISEKINITIMEKNVAVEIAKGYSGKKISEILKISFGTFKTHRKNLFYKTRTNNSVSLVYFLSKYGFI